MNISDITKINYTKLGSMVTINDEPTEYPVNHVLAEAWRNMGNTVLPYEPSLEGLKKDKIEELEAYHNSDDVRILKITKNGDSHHFAMNERGRNLISEQILDLQMQIDLGIIAEADASFTYVNGGSVDLSLTQLKGLYTKIMSIIKPNYTTYINHKNNIKTLNTIDEINSYDFKEGYLKNNSMIL